MSATQIKKHINDRLKLIDILASKVERLPMPEGQHVNVESGQLAVRHPLSAEKMQLDVPPCDHRLTEQQRQKLLTAIDGLPGSDKTLAQNRFLAIWRLWPEALLGVHPCFGKLPAETRLPDHTIWNHLDVTAAMKAAEADKGGAALLAFVLGPVQQFIEASRSVRDLWSGSMILSWLAFRAMLPVIEQFGPTALIYPAMRGNPLLDLWLRDAGRLGNKVPLPDVKRRLTASLPHRFLAIVPWGEQGIAARALAEECRRAVAEGWRQMADAVRSSIGNKLAALYAGWDRRWDGQVGTYFAASTAVIPLRGIGRDDPQQCSQLDTELAELLAGQPDFRNAFADAEAVREMARAIPSDHQPGYSQDHAGRWQYQVELVNRALAAHRAIRHVPGNPTSGNAHVRVPLKCTILFSFEQMGPDDLAESKRFWDDVANSQNGLNIDGVRIRKGEALCAVAMVKRFAGPAFLAQQLYAQPAELRFPDTWTIAAAEWLNKAGIDPDGIRRQHGDWNGQWLGWRTEQDDADEPKCQPEVLATINRARARLGSAPVYYAILKLDGDDLGNWLRGEKSPKVREVMHCHLVRYYEGLGGDAKAGLDARRPVSPALHAAISTALANFALHAVPEIVSRHHGTTIYAGGDDTLVLLPVSTALACALKLRRAYMSTWWSPDAQDAGSDGQGQYMMMGRRATLSGGLVIVHAKDDLRLALQDARRAEDQAKQAGKDALVITVRRRSGEHTSALCPWCFTQTVDTWRTQFAAGASDRWAYHLMAEGQTLAALDEAAILSEIRRQVNRAEKPTRRLLGEPKKPKEGERAGDIVSNQLSAYWSTVKADRDWSSLPKALNAWLTLCQTASFMARGREQ
ncbi:MAG TPA: type III-B CRISPR-associated protein Cas10/Cmr2 [Tepidisphaeraceae bacterium]|nr:type III-B CRISPR-associated protein Cas10/Cmr2 [Tepidisphaeraceae bacterium]